MPLHEVATALQTLMATSFAPGAMPRVRAVQALAGNDVGDVRAVALEVDRVRVFGARRRWATLSPTKSKPSTTLAVGNRPSRVVFCGSVVAAP